MLALIEPVDTLVEIFDALLVFLHDTFSVGWGTAIVLLTVVVRIILLPLTIKQFRSMQSMARLAPEIKALQEKYKHDKQRQQQEMMAFYKEHQVNPFGSCLPLLLQMPVFISLFYLLQRDLKGDICGGPCDAVPPGAAEFLFISDITEKATGGVLVALIVLYILSQLASSVLMAVSADRNQRLLMIGLPFLFTTFIITFPAGLIVYWITTNLWTVGQQYFIRRRMGPITPPKLATAGAPAAAAAPGKKDKQDKGDRTAGGGGDKQAKSKPSGPPPSARRKKKRSGRRR